MSMEKPKAAAHGGTEWTDGEPVSRVLKGGLEG